MGYMAELPDLRQEHPRVANLLVEWVKSLRRKFAIDGFRMDALPYANKSFYQLLKREALSDVYTTGEVVIGGAKIDFSANYQVQRADARGDTAADAVHGPVIDGIINYDFNNALQSTLQIVDPTMPEAATHGTVKKLNRPLTHLAEHWKAASEQFADVGALTNFISVHDQPRWLYTSPDKRTYQNAFVITFFMPGIPVNYYGDEQSIRGGNDDNTCRPPLWRYGYDQNAPLYKFTKRAVAARKMMLSSLEDDNIDEIKHLRVTDESLSFQRGAAVVIVGKVIPEEVDILVTIATAYPEGTLLCDVLEPEPELAYCAFVHGEGIFERKLSGLPLVLFPKSASVAIASQIETAFFPAWCMIVGASMLLAGGVVLVRRHALGRQHLEDRFDDMPTDFVRLH